VGKRQASVKMLQKRRIRATSRARR